MIVDTGDRGVYIAVGIPYHRAMFGDAGEAGAQVAGGDADDLPGDVEVGLLVGGGGVAVAGELEGAHEVVGLVAGQVLGDAANFTGGADGRPAGGDAANGLVVDDAQHVLAVFVEGGGPGITLGVVDEAGDGFGVGGVPLDADDPELLVGQAGEGKLALDATGGIDAGLLDGLGGGIEQ